MARSAWGVSVSVSVALLLPGVGSVTPAGAVIVAVLTRVPVTAGLTWTVKVKVTVALTGRLTVVARAPLPALGPATLPPPLLAVAVQVALVTPVGTESETLAPVTALGPALRTTMVYVVLVPGTAATTPSVLVMDRSAICGVSVALAVLLVRSGSVTPVGRMAVAVLVW